MIRIRHLVGLTAAALLAATPAAAQTGLAVASNSATPPSLGADAPRTARAEADDERKICVRAEFTGSRMVRRICKTQAEWERAGGLPSSRE